MLLCPCFFVCTSILIIANKLGHYAIFPLGELGVPNLILKCFTNSNGHIL